MNRILITLAGFTVMSTALFRCSQDEVKSSASSASLSATKIDVAQTSGQLASGTSFRISGSSMDSMGVRPPDHHHGPHGPHEGGCPPLLDGLSLIAPTKELLAIVDAETAGDFRGFRISENGGATITNYNAEGETVSLVPPRDGGPQGCSTSGGQFPKLDSVLSTIVKTVIDFGTGVTFKHDTVTITRAGKIIITRSGSKGNLTEVITFDGYSVNGITIAGTKTRITTLDSSIGVSTSTTRVTDGVITFTDGTKTDWVSDRTRIADITLDSVSERPVNGTITTEVNTSVKTSDGTVIYSHETIKPLIENLACEGRKHGPASGTVQTIYRSDTLVIDFGDGSCSNQTITITLNGETTTKTIGG